MSKKLMVIWFLVISLLLGSLLFIHYNSLDKDLLNIENIVKKASYNYFKDNNMFPNINESSIVYISDLIEKDYLKEDEKIEKYCIVSVRVINRLFVKMYEIDRNCSPELKGN